MPEPINKILYEKIKNEGKNKFKTWPSVYASAWLVREYKKQGGKYKGRRPSKDSGLSRWFEEEWIDVCKLPKKVPCGRPKISVSNWKKKYPYCRPSKRISKSTPKTVSELRKKEIIKRCYKKKKNPLKRIK